MVLISSKSTRREKWAWYFYDFGNSAYAAVVVLAIYATYFKDSVVGRGETGTALWSQALLIAGITVALSAPILGSIADFSGSKKRFLFFFTMMSVIFCAMLFFVQKGDILIGMVFFILAEIGYRSSQVFYNSLLPDIAHQDEMAKISGNGWAFGSLGGIICLIIVLAAIIFLGDNGQGLLPTSMIVRWAMVFTAAYYLASASLTFFWVKERGEPQSLPEDENHLTFSFKRLSATFKKLKDYDEFVKYIFAFFIYNAAIMMALDYAAIIGLVLFGIKDQALIIFMIIVQVASVIGGYLGGYIADRFDNKRSLVIMILVMMLAVVGLFFNNSITGFYILGCIVGLALSSVQAVSRGLVGIISPPGQSAEFYGLLAFAGRTSNFLAPLFGFLAFLATRWFRNSGQALLWFTTRNEMGAETLAEQNGHRLALVLIVLSLSIGLAALRTVNESKARRAALQSAAEPAVK